QTGKTHRVRFARLIASGLGRHVLSSSLSRKPGIATILEEGNPNLRKGSVVAPVQQRKEDLGQISFEMEIDANSGASSPGTGAAPLLRITGASSPGIAPTSGVATRRASLLGIAKKTIPHGVAGALSPKATGATSSGAAGASSPRATGASP
ncbi:unnamed protein product, partial [Laminaria digitata]